MKKVDFTIMFIFSVAAGILMIPLVWVGLIPLSILGLILVLSCLPIVPFLEWEVRNPSLAIKKPRVLLIDNDSDPGILDKLNRAWQVSHAKNSFLGIRRLLESSEFDFVLVRWKRRKLSGEAILDYLDNALQVQEARHNERAPSHLPPVVFLRKRGTEPFRLHHRHRFPVKGCIGFDSANLLDEFKMMVHY